MSGADTPTIAPSSGERKAVGPGLVFALSVVGAGDYVATSGHRRDAWRRPATYLLVASVCRYVWVNACARYVLVTGETPFAGFARVNGDWCG